MAEKIRSIAIEDKMKDSYLSYSLSVIASRALPDVRDGLKPVHRRILYAARELGLTHDKPHKKSARIVGEVLGKYHPHGDASVYDAMVRMAQYFNQRYCLIDGHGNFGSIDGDSPAAMRYTEARLTELAEDIMADITQDTVDFVDNFDGSLQEPEILPTKVPNLLINGASGIAVGMSTSIPPHNLGEVVDAMVHLLKHPNAKLETIMKYIPGPDFPTGAKIVGLSGIKKAYKTGNGKITLRARTQIEKKGRKKQIIIKEIPYHLNKVKLLEDIAELINKGKIDNVSDLRDESDQEGLRIVVELKSGADPDIILNQLYKFTSLQTNYRINMLALDGKQPRVMDLITILKNFINFRRQVITRRTKYKLNKAKERFHLLQGLITAIDKLDLVISIIRHSKSTKEARQKLQEKLVITEKQAEAILRMRLQKLVGMEEEKLHQESAGLEEQIKYYKKILNNKNELDKVLKKELLDIKNKYADKRKTEIIEDEEKAIIEKTDLIKKEKVFLTFSYRQNIKRTTSSEYARAGKNDYIIDTMTGTTLDTLLFFTNTGDVYTLPVHKIPEHHGLSTGDNIKDFLKIPLSKKIVKVICLNEETKEKYITIATKQGMVKKTIGGEYQTTYSRIKAIKLNKGDEVVGVEITDGNQEILLGTKKAKTIRFEEDSVSDTGRNTIGSIGIKLAKGDEVVSFNLVNNNTSVVSISKTGRGKRSPIEEYNPQNRNGKGLKTCGSSIYKMAGVICANPDDYILITTGNEKLYTVKVNDLTETSRTGNMYEVVSLKNDDKITGVEKLPFAPEEDNN
ncbi:DNA gyrase subunit A [Halothermothrix orenii]|uniref:DNA topoisomerase (ATP-hydrolyzing) n=1 Tax=Halothermothrix orenii (strain H 168 / OCM 544 / DSM 9562) TaxID=373903 RepID=B8CXA6_HALOH|nr:DNA gyrase subunit A [Halothermothrix orenii]ACL69925.1 DNA gyrase subunit A [Halothermothrix orenii H 168]